MIQILNDDEGGDEGGDVDELGEEAKDPGFLEPSEEGLVGEEDPGALAEPA